MHTFFETRLLLATLVLALTAGAAGAVTQPSLEAIAGAGACGGTLACVTSVDNTKTPAAAGFVLKADAHRSLIDGSYANAVTAAAFGILRVYSDAFRAAGSDAQSQSDARSVEIIPGDQIVANIFNYQFVITGSHSNVEPIFGNSALVSLNWHFRDAVTGSVLASGVWESTDLKPQATLADTFFVPTGHAVEEDLVFSTFTYSSFGVVDIADYGNTLHEYASTAPGGGDVVGLSGHDYAHTAVPEPATWAMITLGVCLLGARLRRRATAGASRKTLLNAQGG